MSIFINNLKALKGNDEVLYNAVEKMCCERNGQPIDAENEELKEFTFTRNAAILSAGEGVSAVKNMEARNGQEYIVMSDENGQDIAMNSRYSPENEASKYAIQYSNQTMLSILLFGFGNGEFATRIIDVLDKNSQIYSYEPSVAIFAHVMTHVDITGLFEDKRFKLYVSGINKDDLELRLNDEINFINKSGFVINSLPVYSQMFDREYDYLMKVYNDVLSSKEMDENTTRRYAKTSIVNALYNLRYLPGAFIYEDLIGRLDANMPVVLVSAGPSLEKNAGILKDYVGKVLIVAVDNAVKYLSRLGIRPDMIVCIDNRKSLDCFEGGFPLDVPMVIHPEFNYMVLEKLFGKGFSNKAKVGNVIFAGDDSKYFSSYINARERVQLPVSNGGSVSTFAYSMLVNMGFKKIIMIGLDLATDDGKLHAGDSTKTADEVYGNYVEVEGLNGDTVKTTYDFNQFIKWFNVAVAYFKDTKTIDATEGGALISAMETMTLEEALKDAKTEYDITGVFDFIEPVYAKNEGMLIKHMVEESLEDLLVMREIMDKAIATAREGIIGLRVKNPDSGWLGKISENLNQISVIVENSREAYLADQYMLGENMDVITDDSDSDDPVEATLNMLKNIEKYYRNLSQGLDEVGNIMNELLYR